MDFDPWPAGFSGVRVSGVSLSKASKKGREGALQSSEATLDTDSQVQIWCTCATSRRMHSTMRSIQKPESREGTEKTRRMVAPAPLPIVEWGHTPCALGLHGPQDPVVITSFLLDGIEELQSFICRIS